MVDDKIVVNEVQVFRPKVTDTYDFGVGHTETHKVSIEQKRERLFAGFRPQHYRVLVDGEVLRQFDGK